MKVCILAAGQGTRMGKFSTLTHKTLLPLGNVAILTRIINQFKDCDDFVIAVGDKKELVEDYVKIAHPEINVTFMIVENFSGTGSGPGFTLFECKHCLQEPFIFTACDTIITSSIPNLNQNWIGVKEVNDIEKWCSVKTDSNHFVCDFFYKQPVDTKLAFIGIAYVHDYQDFWDAFNHNNGLIGNELQVNNGLNGLIPKGLLTQQMDWIDTGTETNYINSLKYFEKNFSFAEKHTDITYRINDNIIKFFPDKSISELRFTRAKSYKNIFTSVKNKTGNYYSYLYQPGNVLSKELTYHKCLSFLEWAQKNLWIKDLSTNSIEFEKITYMFYFTKTMRRIDTFIDKFLPEKKESNVTINALSCACAKDLVREIDQNFYKESLPSMYHGDLHADNIICTSENDYRLIDWRHNFGDSVHIGDLYYDLSKFYHTLVLSVNTMEKNYFHTKTIDMKKNQIFINHALNFNEFDAADAFWRFIKQYDYDPKRIKIIDALIFLNMSPLYSQSMAIYLYYLGRYLLHKALHIS